MSDELSQRCGYRARNFGSMRSGQQRAWIDPVQRDSKTRFEIVL